MVRLLVADAHCIARIGMKQLCREMGGFRVEAEAANGAEMLEALSATDFDMVVVDTGLPRRRRASDRDTGGAAIIQMIRARNAQLPILAFATNVDPQTIKRLLSSGASGFIGKSSDRETIMEAMHKVAAGQSFISSEIATLMVFENGMDRATVLRSGLTRRESQILTLLGQGKNITAIADELLISSRTVSTHKQRLMQKMQFTSNAELFHYAFECEQANAKQQGAQAACAAKLAAAAPDIQHEPLATELDMAGKA